MFLEFAVSDKTPKECEADTLVIPAWSEGFPAQLGSIRILIDLWRRGTITGKFEEVKVIYTNTRWQQVVVFGLGERKAGTAERARLCGAALVKTLTQLGSKSVCMVTAKCFAAADAGKLEGLVEGIILAGYRFDTYKTRLPETGPEITWQITAPKELVPEFAAVVYKAEVLAGKVNLARDWVNEPGNCLTPQGWAARVQALAETDALQCQILGRAEMVKAGMGGLLGVARGSDEPPCLIILTYTGAGKAEHLVYIGKGLTFDAGGISLKSDKGMEEMKSDMAGGAAVIAALAAIAELKLPVNVTAIVAATENMPDGAALKPGDVVKICDGTTVEIISTDSEGRLVLADAIAYAKRLEPSAIVDVATLTGACSSALGPFYAGLWSNDQYLCHKIIQAAGISGERFWPMPYDELFFRRMQGQTADLRNSGGREGSPCNAAAFLGSFAHNIPWAHLDIAPNGYADSAQGYTPKGGTGVAVRTLVHLASAWANQKKTAD